MPAQSPDAAAEYHNRDIWTPVSIEIGNGHAERVSHT